MKNILSTNLTSGFLEMNGMKMLSILRMKYSGRITDQAVV